MFFLRTSDTDDEITGVVVCGLLFVVRRFCGSLLVVSGARTHDDESIWAIFAKPQGDEISHKQ